MPRYRISAPDGNSYEVTAPNGASQEDVLNYAKANYAKAPRPTQSIDNAFSSYRNSPAYSTSPQGMLENLNTLASKGANKAGEMFATTMAERGMNPNLSAGIGTFMQMAPDLITTAATPVGEPEEAPDAAVGMMRRALGYQKGTLKTPFARGRAANAAKVALEEGIMPGSGSPDVAFSRANEFKGSMGRALGDMRESVGPQEIKPVFRQLDSLKRRLTEGGSKGGAWDIINEKINFAKRTLLGLYEGSANKPIFEERPPVPNPTAQAPSAPFSPPFRQKIGPMEAEKLNMRGNTLPSSDVIPDAPKREQLGYWNNPPNFKERPRNIIDAEIIPDETADKITKKINRVGLNSVEAAKKRLGGDVNWLSDRNSQSDAKGISNAIESGVEEILRANGVPMDRYRALKNKYSAGSSMVGALNNEIAGTQSRMMPSATGIVMGAGKLAGGDPMGAIRDVGLWELLRRRGAGIGATSAYKAGEVIPRSVTALRMLRKKDEDSNP